MTYGGWMQIKSMQNPENHVLHSHVNVFSWFEILMVHPHAFNRLWEIGTETEVVVCNLCAAVDFVTCFQDRLPC